MAQRRLLWISPQNFLKKPLKFGTVSTLLSRTTKKNLYVFISSWHVYLELGQRQNKGPCGDWHVRRASCQSPAQSISRSQSVLFVCSICFKTQRPFADMGAKAGKTFLWRESQQRRVCHAGSDVWPEGSSDMIVLWKPGPSPSSLSAFKWFLSFLLFPFKYCSCVWLLLLLAIYSWHKWNDQMQLFKLWELHS